MAGPVSEAPVVSTMQDDYPLTVTAIMRHGMRVYGRSEAITWQGERAEHVSFAEVGANAARLAGALARLGVGERDRVATFCWNHRQHLEAYYAVPCMGAVLHTLNIRLPVDQVAHIVNHAADKIIIVDASLAGLLAPIAGSLTSVEAFIVVGDGDASALGDATVHRYDELVASERPDYPWPELDERAPASMCYTSGTTGDPKGVVYSHRSTYLHAIGTLSNCVTGARESDRVLTVVPMFHVNAWGIPFGAFFCGSSLLLPGPHMMPGGLCDFIAAERPTLLSGVPTIWGAILQAGEQRDIDLSSLRMGTSGGAAIPRSMVEAFRDKYDLPIVQGWGMTETSPVCGISHPPLGVGPGTVEDIDWRMRSGRVIAGVEMRVVDDAGAVLPCDGESVGEIEVRGPWITGSYHHAPTPEKFDDGWLRTGDIGWLDDRGFFLITDRSKDVIKSGGEWISSVELENLLAGSPAVLEAAVIGIPDPRWTERPLACVVRRPEAGESGTPAQLARFLAGQVASWQVPENWTFIDEVPKTSVGKFDKKVLRARFAAGDLTVERTKD
jgi:fatty-acyl-CoA synthase